MRETSQSSNVLFGNISFSGSIVLGSTSSSFSDSVDFLVQLGSVVISTLTSSGNTPGDSSRMPSSDTSDFSVTSMRFLLEMFDSPSSHYTFKSMTLSDTNNVKNIILAEDVIDSNLLFKESLNESNFVSNSFSSVDLDFEDVVLLLSQVFKEVVSLNFFFFIKFSFSSVNISEDMGHTGFESTEGCEMRSLGSIISRE